MKYMIELLHVEDSLDANVKIDTFEKLNNSLFIFTHSLYDNKVEIDYHLSELEGKYIRFGFANQSIITLLRGSSFTLIDTKTTIIDVFSIHSIMRMQIESFIWMFYLFYDDISKGEKEFRYNIYKLHGLLKQSRFEIKDDEDKENILAKRNEILNEIEQLREKIKVSSLYLESSEKDRKNHLDPRQPRSIESNILFEKSRLGKSRMRDLWNLYSNHAHAEHIGDRQANAITNNGSIDINTISNILSACSILTARLIKNLLTEFPSINNVYLNMTEQEKVPIDIWSGLSN
jgi:hypothetical protein